MPHATLAAVDLGSNSFHLQIARVLDDQLYPLDSLKETVRLGGGITADKKIESVTAERALAALRLFGERLRGMPRGAVRVVGTNALRVAKNAGEFIREAERALGYPIEIIAGREEARLIYLGVAKNLPTAKHDRMVVDIGGGSTEFIIGHRLKPKLMDSLYMGCVSYSARFFPDGAIDKRRFKEAQFAARKEIEQIRSAFLKMGWYEAFGSSGTARALAQVATASTPAGCITREDLERMRDRAIKAGSVGAMDLAGVKADRLPVISGGLAIMLTIFEELGIERMQVVDSALRDGVLYDMLGRDKHVDIREATIAQFAKRYHVDVVQAARVEALAVTFLDQLGPSGEEHTGTLTSHQRLAWAARLHEAGIAISQAGFHKHSAYILAQADMPGFSKREQAALAALVLAARGKLVKVQTDIERSGTYAAEVLCLRLAALLSRSRRHVDSKAFSLARRDGDFVFSVEAAWLAKHDLTDYELRQETAEWARLGITLRISEGR